MSHFETGPWGPSEKFEKLFKLTENENMRFGSKILHAFMGSLLILPISSFGKKGIPASPITGMSISYQSKPGQMCMSKVAGGKADTILNRYGVKIDGSRAEVFEQGLATALQRVADLGRPDLIQNLKIKMFPDGRPKKNGKSCASYTYPKELHIVAGSGACNRNIGTNAATTGMHILHELGHSVGLGGYYNSYHSSVPKCNITGYCSHNSNPSKRNEEFAEVFAMYVHSPQVLQKVCPQAHDFMKANVFKGKQSTANLCQGIPATAIAGGTTPPSDSFAGSAESASRGYNGGGGTQIANLAQALLPVAAMMMQKKQEAPAQPSSEVLIIPKGQNQAIPLDQYQPGTGVR